MDLQKAITIAIRIKPDQKTIIAHYNIYHHLNTLSNHMIRLTEFIHTKENHRKNNSLSAKGLLIPIHQNSVSNLTKYFPHNLKENKITKLLKTEIQN